jgi:hypothetical protein
VGLRQLLIVDVKFAQGHHNGVDSELIQTRLARELDQEQQEVVG